MEHKCDKIEELNNIKDRLKDVEMESQNNKKDFSTIKKRCDTQCSEIQDLKKSQKMFENEVDNKFNRFEDKLDKNLNEFEKKFEDHKKELKDDAKDSRKSMRNTIITLTGLTLTIWAGAMFRFSDGIKKSNLDFKNDVKRDIANIVDLKVEVAKLQTELKFTGIRNDHTRIHTNNTNFRDSISNNNKHSKK